MILRSLVLCAVCALWGCELETARAGESCKRSTQCQAGLVCVRSKCTKDLGPIADESVVPDLGMGTGMGAAEGGVAAADGGGMPQAGNASNAGAAASGGAAGGGS